MSSGKPSTRRRTQDERRQSTIRKLIDAATEALVEVGYANASVQRICERAGVSQGGLFRHFESREALMVAVGKDLGKAALERYRRQFESLRDREDQVVLAIGLVRDQCHFPMNQAWYELAMAARTSPSLRKGLKPVADAFYTSIEQLARELLPDLADGMGANFVTLVDVIVAAFDGEMIRRFVQSKTAPAPDKVDLLKTLAVPAPAIPAVRRRLASVR